MNVIEVEPLPSNVESDEWLQDSRRIMKRNELENSQKSLNLKIILIAE